MVSDAVSKLSQNVVRVDVKIDNEWGNGTGLLLDNIGTVLTCDHVVRPNNKNPEKIQITKDDALPKNAEIVRYDQLLDVALIQAIDFSLVLIMAIVGGRFLHALETL